MREGRRLNLTIGQLFCQQFFKISIFLEVKKWRRRSLIIMKWVKVSYL